MRNGLAILDSNYLLLSGAWLHDVLEDTSITKEKFINLFGIKIYNLVWALTDGEGKTRKEKKGKMYEKLIYNQDAIIVKLADRIANLKFSSNQSE